MADPSPPEMNASLHEQPVHVTGDLRQHPLQLLDELRGQPLVGVEAHAPGAPASDLADLANRPVELVGMIRPAAKQDVAAMRAGDLHRTIGAARIDDPDVGIQRCQTGERMDEVFLLVAGEYDDGEQGG